MKMLFQRSATVRVFSVLLVLALVFSFGAVAFADVEISAVFLPGSDTPEERTLTIGDDALWITLPEGKTYLLTFDDLSLITEAFFGEEGPDLPESDEPLSEEDAAALAELALRYGKILISVATIFNISRKKMEVPLSAFGETSECTVLACSPSRKDWTRMLKKLFDTAAADEQLLSLAPEGLSGIVAKGQAELDAIIDTLDGVALQVATDESGIRAVKILRKDDFLSYQTAGGEEAASRHAIVLGQAGEETTLLTARVRPASGEVPGGALPVKSPADLLAALFAALPIRAAGALLK